MAPEPTHLWAAGAALAVAWGGGWGFPSPAHLQDQVRRGVLFNFRSLTMA